MMDASTTIKVDIYSMLYEKVLSYSQELLYAVGAVGDGRTILSRNEIHEQMSHM